MDRICLNYFCVSFFTFVISHFVQCNEHNHTWVSLSDDLPYEYLFSDGLRRPGFSTRHEWIHRNWYDARRWCRENGGGDLLTITSNLEANLLLDTILGDENSTMRCPSRRVCDYWTGLQDLNIDGNWTWMDGTEVDWNIMHSVNVNTDTLKQPSRSYWRKYFPKLCAHWVVWENKGSQKNRFTLFPKRRLVPISCAEHVPFVCKRSLGHLDEVSADWRHYLPKDYYNNLPSSCPEGFTDISTKCLRFSHENVTSLTWNEAQQVCVDHYGPQSSLASFHDKRELLQMIAETPQHFSRSEYWIGLERRGPGRGMSWIDNSYLVTLPIIKTLSHNFTTFPYVTNCIYLSYEDESPKFSRGPCRNQKKFICQIGRVPKDRNVQEIFNSSSCPAGYYGIEETCYKFHSEETTFDEAEMICNNDSNSHTTSVVSYYENSLLQLLVEENNATNIWVGLRIKHTLQQRKNVVSYWNDGQPVFYANWIQENDEYLSHKQNRCTKMTDGWSGSWMSVTCQQKLPFICKLVEKKPHSLIITGDIFCPSSWYAFNGTCYYIHEEQDTTYQEAVKACIHLDTRASLGSIYTTKEKRAIKYFLRNKNHPGLWTGTFIGKSGNSMNIDGSSRIDERLRRNDMVSQSEEKCARLSWKEGIDSVYWTKCDKNYGFVCKTPPLNHPEMILSNISWDGCPSRKWVRRGEYCYLFLPDQYLSRRQAERKCASQEVKSSLVSIQDSQENHFIQVIMHEKSELSFHRWAWISYRKDSEEHSNWENFESENWRTDNSLRPGSSCVAMETTTGFWASKPCDDLFGAVCKTPIHIPTEISVASNTEINDFESTTGSMDTSPKESVILANSVDEVNTSNKVVRASNQIHSSSESHQSRILNIVFNTIVIALLLIFVITILKHRNFLSCNKKAEYENRQRSENKDVINLRTHDNSTHVHM